MKFLFGCDGCWKEEISYMSSHLAAESRRHPGFLSPILILFYQWAGLCLLSENFRQRFRVGCSVRKALSGSSGSCPTLHQGDFRRVV